MVEIPTVPLHDGRAIPQLGLGSLRVRPDDPGDPVLTALQEGYRSIDTAAVYGNERAVGRALRASGLAREDVFLTTKVWNGDHGREPALAAFEASLERLGVEYVDLYLIHWPMAALGRTAETWAALGELQRQGRARSIGVSNFLVEHLQALADSSDVVPVVNQVELHPYLQQRELLAHHAEHGIRTEAWSPIAKGAALRDPVVLEIAEAHGRTPAQVVLRWHVQQGRVVIPKSSSRARLRENRGLWDFELSAEESARIDALDRGERIGSHPDSPPTNPLPADQ